MVSASAAVLAFTAVEIGLRLFWTAAALQRRLATEFILDDAAVGLVHARNATIRFPFPEHRTGELVFRTNNLGLRKDTDTSESKLSGVFRILVLGDSQTDGGVYNQESYVNRLERLIPSMSGERIEALNTGLGGSHPPTQWLWLKSYGRRLRRDLVIVVDLNDVGNEIIANALAEFLRASGLLPLHHAS